MMGLPASNSSNRPTGFLTHATEPRPHTNKVEAQSCEHSRGSPLFVSVAFVVPGAPREAFLVPVVVVDVGTVEALDHFGGAGAGFDGLEDAEGDERAAIFIVQAVRVDGEGDVGEGLGEVEGVHADLPDVVPAADVKGRGVHLPRDTGVDVREFERDVADAGAPVGDAELAGARGDVLAILAAHVRDARANLRLCCPEGAPVRRHCLHCILLHLRRLMSTRLRPLCRVHPLALSFIRLWVAEQHTAPVY